MNTIWIHLLLLVIFVKLLRICALKYKKNKSFYNDLYRYFEDIDIKKLKKWNFISKNYACKTWIKKLKLKYIFSMPLSKKEAINIKYKNLCKSSMFIYNKLFQQHLTY